MTSCVSLVASEPADSEVGDDIRCNELTDAVKPGLDQVLLAGPYLKHKCERPVFVHP